MEGVRADGHAQVLRRQVGARACPFLKIWDSRIKLKTPRIYLTM